MFFWSPHFWQRARKQLREHESDLNPQTESAVGASSQWTQLTVDRRVIYQMSKVLREGTVILFGLLRHLKDTRQQVYHTPQKVNASHLTYRHTQRRAHQWAHTHLYSISQLRLRTKWFPPIIHPYSKLMRLTPSMSAQARAWFMVLYPILL